MRAISDDGSERWNYGSMTLQFQNGKLMGSASQIPPDPLFVAARQGDISQLETLLMGGSDPNMRDSDGGTPLMAACEGERNTAIVRSGSLRMTPTSGPGNPDAVRMLMSHGADPNLVDEWGSSALWFASRYDRERSVAILLDNGGDPNLTKNGRVSPLSSAAEQGHLGVVKRLLKAGSNIDSRDKGGQTPLIAASYNGHVEIVIALLDAGADVNASDTGGHTPLSNAAFQGQSEVVRLLIKRGARIDDKDDEGKDALAIAKEGGHTQVIEILTTAFMEGPQSK
jgi:ankyrin repeat protein